MITVYEFCSLFTDPSLQNVIVDDTQSDGGVTQVFAGCASDLKESRYADAEVQSIDTIYEAGTAIVINICSN